MSWPAPTGEPNDQPLQIETCAYRTTFVRPSSPLSKFGTMTVLALWPLGVLRWAQVITTVPVERRNGDWWPIHPGVWSDIFGSRPSRSGDDPITFVLGGRSDPR